MTENQPETADTNQAEAADLPDPETVQLTDPPADASDDVATGHAVFDRVLGTYVGGVYRDKAPSKTEASKLAGRPSAHVAIVKV